MKHEAIRVFSGFAYSWNTNSWYICPILSTMSPSNRLTNHPDHDELDDYDDNYVAPGSTEHHELLDWIIKENSKTSKFDGELDPECDLNEFDEEELDDFETDVDF